MKLLQTIKKPYLSIFKKFFKEFDSNAYKEPIKYDDLINPKSAIVKAIVFLYSIESFLPYSLNKALRDNDAAIKNNLRSFANVLSIIIEAA